MKKIITALLVLILLASVVFAECPSGVPDDVSSSDSISDDCLNQIPPAVLAANPNTRAQLRNSGRFERLDETRKNYFYQNYLNEFQSQFSNEHNVALSDCTANCRYENGMLYNEPSQSGVNVALNSNNIISALPDGGFRITGVGEINVGSNSINCGGSECSVDAISYGGDQGVAAGPGGISSGQPALFIQVLGGDYITVNGRTYTSGDGGVITILGEGTNQQYRFSGVTFVSDGLTIGFGAVNIPSAVTPAEGVGGIPVMVQPVQGGADALIQQVSDFDLDLGDFLLTDSMIQYQTGPVTIRADYDLSSQPLQRVYLTYSLPSGGKGDARTITATADPAGTLSIQYNTRTLSVRGMYSPSGTDIGDALGVIYYFGIRKRF